MEASDNYESLDKEAVKSMFRTLSDSVSAVDGKWQAIVIEHAGEDIWGGIPNVVKADEWRSGRKLIPETWYASVPVT